MSLRDEIINIIFDGSSGLFIPAGKQADDILAKVREAMLGQLAWSRIENECVKIKGDWDGEWVLPMDDISTALIAALDAITE